jgi:hypothetical protein
MSGEHAHDEYAEAILVEKAIAEVDQRVAYLAARVSTLTAQVVTLEAEQSALTKDIAAMATWHDYSGKPSGSLVVKAGDYVRVDVDVADPPRTGAAELHMLYVNSTLAWKAGETQGVIRVKYTREDGDETGYQDYVVTKDGVIGSPGSFLLTSMHFEAGEAGMGGRWWIRCGGGLSAITLTTRYCKILQVG